VTEKLEEYKKLQGEIAQLTADNPEQKTPEVLNEEIAKLRLLKRQALRLAASLEKEESAQSSDVYIDRDW
jgi:hypothetical protein